MRRRGSRVAAGVIGLAGTLALSGCVPNACPAIGYVDISPVELVFEGGLPAQPVVSACFGSDCEPMPVPADSDGRHRVPQQTPFVNDSFGRLESVRVVVRAGARVLHDAVHAIPVRSERTGFWGQCPGPWSYGPVEIRLG